MKVTIKHISVLGAFKFGCGIYILGLICLFLGLSVIGALIGNTSGFWRGFFASIQVLPMGTIPLIASSTVLNFVGFGVDPFFQVVFALFVVAFLGAVQFALLAIFFNLVTRVLGGITFTMVRQQPSTQNEN